METEKLLKEEQLTEIKKFLAEDQIQECLDYIRLQKGSSFDLNSPLDSNGHRLFHLGCFFCELPSSLVTLQEAGCDIFSTYGEGFNCFHHTAYTGDIGKLNQLIKLGIKPDCESNEGYNALFTAARNDKVEAFMWLHTQFELSLYHMANEEQ